MQGFSRFAIHELSHGKNTFWLSCNLAGMADRLSVVLSLQKFTKQKRGVATRLREWKK